MIYGTPCYTTGHFVFCYHHVTYRTLCHASSHLVIYHDCYGFERALFTRKYFLPYNPSCWFQGFPGAGSSTSKLAELHVDLWNIVPVWLFVWITTIHKRGMVQVLWVTGWPANEESASYGIQAFSTIGCMPEALCFIRLAT